jgi:hypothetical protein
MAYVRQESNLHAQLWAPESESGIRARGGNQGRRLKLRRSGIVQTAAMALAVPAHDQATVDAECIPASKS